MDNNLAIAHRGDDNSFLHANKLILAHTAYLEFRSLSDRTVPANYCFLSIARPHAAAEPVLSYVYGTSFPAVRSLQALPSAAGTCAVKIRSPA